MDSDNAIKNSYMSQKFSDLMSSPPKMKSLHLLLKCHGYIFNNGLGDK